MSSREGRRGQENSRNVKKLLPAQTACIRRQIRSPYFRKSSNRQRRSVRCGISLWYIIGATGSSAGVLGNLAKFIPIRSGHHRFQREWVLSSQGGVKGR